MKLESLQELYVKELRDIYNAENQIIKALPKMIKKSSNPQLKQAFTDHLEVTRAQVERLDQIFADLGKRATGKKCVGMEGLIEEGKELIEEEPEPEVLDAGLIGAAQRVEHYEIAAYGTVRSYAELMGFERHAQLLQETLDEEGDADKLLTQIAESSVNVEAEVAGDEAEVGVRSSREPEAGGRRGTSGSKPTGGATKRGGQQRATAR
jgi:ferritin-like metal-binding protein YciE